MAVLDYERRQIPRPADPFRAVARELKLWGPVAPLIILTLGAYAALPFCLMSNAHYSPPPVVPNTNTPITAPIPADPMPCL